MTTLLYDAVVQLPFVSASLFDGRLLLFVVLAGLLPQFATIVIRFTEPSFNLIALLLVPDHFLSLHGECEHLTLFDTTINHAFVSFVGCQQVDLTRCSVRPSWPTLFTL